MSDFHLRQIKAYLHKHFDGKINLSDQAGLSDSEAEPAFFTRSLAALSIMTATGVPADEAAAAVTDGTGDNGVDAVHFHESERLLVMVRSEWLPEGKESLDRDDVLRFVEGFKDLINARFGRFGEKVNARAKEIEAALVNTARILLILVHSGTEPLAPHVRQELDDLRAAINDASEVVFVMTFRQADVYRDVTHGMQAAPIDFDVVLYGWGRVDEPFKSVYGQVAASDVARWWREHYPRIFAPNIRVYLGDTDVNSGIVETVRSEPERFWYYNNGITALCSSFEKRSLGGDDPKSGTFACCDVRIVNGAQTVGSIASVADQYPGNLARVRVPIRIISLESCPEGFDRQVTRCNNTQNRIDRRDFVVLDPEHERLRNELQLDGVFYVYKSGESVPPGEQGFDLTEATVARACGLEDVGYAVQTKREIGRLWDDVEREPYTLVFNPQVPGPALWRQVSVLRAAEGAVAAVAANRSGREHMLAAHAGRLVAHLAFRTLPQEITGGSGALGEDEAKAVAAEATALLDRVIAACAEVAPNDYPTTLFRTIGKCRRIAEAVLGVASPAGASAMCDDAPAGPSGA
jgi:hypothetical protein